ncbi:C-C motif chemokine 20 [Micropterus salmoides]|uniref:C-C motif chemokine 20 n=1 Tax=Micropterus salmoides TaxID=27706 RepID=UPI0018EBE9D0|nr:C-C motif chemokine 20 [Micropterus salmoides]
MRQGAKAQQESYEIQLEHLRAATTDCTMRFNTLFFLVITTCLSLVLAQGSFDDCCLKYVKKMNVNSQKHAVSYTMQFTDGSCNIPAVIFKMKRGRVFCADPKEKWVEELVTKIDKKLKKFRTRHRG